MNISRKDMKISRKNMNISDRNIINIWKKKYLKNIEGI
jgi:hypothetical protein